MIITDQFMPGVKCRELVTHARQIRGDIPIILCSGSEEALQDLQKARLNVQRLLPKPLSRSESGEAIQNVLA